jgi:hypothetical protein
MLINIVIYSYHKWNYVKAITWSSFETRVDGSPLPFLFSWRSQPLPKPLTHDHSGPGDHPVSLSPRIVALLLVPRRSTVPAVWAVQGPAMGGCVP